MALELKQPTEQQWADYDVALSICKHGNYKNLLHLEHLDINSRMDALESYIEGYAPTKNDADSAHAVWSELLDRQIASEQVVPPSPSNPIDKAMLYCTSFQSQLLIDSTTIDLESRIVALKQFLTEWHAHNGVATAVLRILEQRQSDSVAKQMLADYNEAMSLCIEGQFTWILERADLDLGPRMDAIKDYLDEHGQHSIAFSVLADLENQSMENCC